MITKMVKRYYCEFCNKNGGASGAMKKHELHCTLNPNRECRMCKIVGARQKEMKDLIAVLPTDGPREFEYKPNMDPTDASLALDVKMQDAIKELEKATEGCPVCMLAALRQSGISQTYWVTFDYSSKMSDAMDTYHREEGE